MSEPRSDDANKDDAVKDDVLEYFGVDGEDGPKFVDTGELSDIDDQTIAPPG